VWLLSFSLPFFFPTIKQNPPTRGCVGFEARKGGKEWTDKGTERHLFTQAVQASTGMMIDGDKKETKKENAAKFC